MEQPHLLTHSWSWRPSSPGGQAVSKPGLTDASAWVTCQGVCTWNLLGGNFPDLAGPEMDSASHALLASQASPDKACWLPLQLAKGGSGHTKAVPLNHYHP